MGYDFHNEELVKAIRKEHECEQCGRKIVIGSPASKGKGLFDGYFYSHYTHVECRAAAWQWAEITDCWGEEFPWFQHMENSEYEHHAWLLECHPIVAERLLILPVKDDES